MTMKKIISGCEAEALRSIEDVRDRWHDDDDTYGRIEFFIMEVFKLLWAWEVSKDKIVNIINAVHSLDVCNSVPGKRRVNGAFRKLVRDGYLYSTSGNSGGSRARHYGINHDRFKKENRNVA